MAELFIMPFRPAFDSNTKSIPGAQIWFTLSGTNTEAAVYEDGSLTTPRANPVVANGIGRIPSTYLDTEAITYRVRIYSAEAEIGVDAPLEEYDPYVPGTIIEGITVGFASVETITDLKAYPGAGGDLVYLAQSGRAGIFKFSDNDLSAEVTADSANGIYAAVDGADGSEGAWVRQYDGAVVFDWFGAVPGDYVDGIGADTYAAFEAMHAYFRATKRNPLLSGMAGAPQVIFPGAQYYSSESWKLKVTVRLTGFGSTTGGWPTTIRFAANKAGIIPSTENTLGDAQESPATTTAAGTIIEGLNIVSDGGAPSGVLTTDLLYSGVRARCRVVVRDCRISNFRGVGVCHSAAVGDGSDPFHGNCNGWVSENVRIEGCRTGGHFVSGGDANAGRGTSIDVNACGRFGIYDESFLSNKYEACQVDGCGLKSNTGIAQTSTVHDGGILYYAKIGAAHADLIASAPAVNANWLVYGAGGASTNFPNWSATPTDTYVPGGAYGHTGSANTSVFDTCYYETGQAPPQISQAAIVFNGFMGAGLKDGAAHIRGSGNGIESNRAFCVLGTHADIPFVRFGGDNSLSALKAVQWGSHTATPSNPGQVSHLYNDGATGDFVWSSYGLRTPFRFTGASTTRTYGRTGTFDNRFTTEVDKLALGNGVDAGNSCRVYVTGTAAPATGSRAQGEKVFNIAPTLIAPLDWHCVSGHATNGGTWGANYIYARADPATGIGYVTGAGGAVTQATSRTTGVTLNAVCGAITLVSAAGSAAWASFTVTNSAVAATDTIRVVQKSGADKYMIHVTAVANGSFEITFATTGGTTTEQPVFNFAVIKAVAA